MICAAPAAHADEAAELDKLLKQGKTEQALQRANKWLTKHPKDVQIRFQKGVILAEQGQRDAAITQFSELAKDHSNLAEVHNNLAVLYAEKGEFDNAQRALEQAIDTHPAYAAAHRNLGNLYEKMAQQAYDKALNSNANTASKQAEATRLALIRDLASASSASTVVASSHVPATPAVTQASTKVAMADIAPPLAVKPTPVPVEPSKPAELPAATLAPKAPIIPAETTKPTPNTEKTTTSTTPSAPEKPVVTPVPKAPVAPAETTKPATEKTTTSTTPATSEKPPATVTALQASEQAALTALEKWAKAWEEKDVDTYLSSYAADFRTPKDQKRKDWENSRRRVIKNSGNIEVKISNTTVKTIAPNQVEIRFYQQYRSNAFSGNTGKTIKMVRKAGKWQIQEENTSR